MVTEDGTEPHLIIVPRVQGQYRVTTTGIDNGAYTLGAFEIISGTTQIAGKILTGTTTVGQSRQLDFDLAIFQEENGRVTLEAEHFTWLRERSQRTWTTQTVLSGYVGQEYIAALPDTDLQFTTNFTNTSPELQYTLNLTTTGTYYVWLRGYAANSAGDSIYLALEDQPVEIITGFAPRQWDWANRIASGGIARLEITEPGLHTIRLWQREDGLRLDRIILTTNISFNPAGDGPPESERRINN